MSLKFFTQGRKLPEERTTQGASATAADTKGKGVWKRGMAIFTLAKGGLMYEASIGGQKYNFKPLMDWLSTPPDSRHSAI